MSLINQIHADVESLFFNENEMAEWHTLNDVRILVVVDSDKLAQWKAVNLPASIALPGMALPSAEVFLFVAESAFSEPMVGEIVRYDGRPLRVESVEVVDGMMELVLSGNS